MQRSLMIVVTLGFILPGLLTTVACSNKAKNLRDKGSISAEDADKAALAEKQRRGMEETGLSAQQGGTDMVAQARERFLTDNIHFAYDSAVLTPIGQNVLNQKAEWLRKNPSGNIIIGGHCDERGTIEYNVALGERRAEAAKRYLSNLGVGVSRMEAVSYGEEMPLAEGDNEEAWAQNRRAQFNIQ